jgi:hypothetical protein
MVDIKTLASQVQAALGGTAKVEIVAASDSTSRNSSTNQRVQSRDPEIGKVLTDRSAIPKKSSSNTSSHSMGVSPPNSGVRSMTLAELQEYLTNRRK